MGGYGAFSIAFDHPDLYVGAISLSGAFTPPIGPDDSRLHSDLSYYHGAFGTPFDAERFNAANLLNRIPALRAADKPAFWMTIGDRDDYPEFIEGAAALQNALRAAAFESHLRVSDGRHSWGFWQREIIPALEWLSPMLAAKCPA